MSSFNNIEQIYLQNKIMIVYKLSVHKDKYVDYGILNTIKWRKNQTKKTQYGTVPKSSGKMIENGNIDILNT